MEKMIVANHKMNMILPDVLEYIDKVSSISNRLIVCPSSIYIPYFVSSGFEVGIQNIYVGDNGAYTGEISAKQAKSVGVSYVIVGHSERRKVFSESDELINHKVKIALQNGLNVILCVGENEGEDYKEVIKKQIIFGLKDVTLPVLITYEPAWAIGSKQLPSNEKIIEVVDYIKSFFDYDVKVLYGGSVDENEAPTLSKVNNLDGFIVGLSSTDYDELITIREVL
ncbi:MAG: triosephosphate isomerase [Bacilli bacterium]|nr:triosephosphate isomerase [Bacilli bacterium]